MSPDEIVLWLVRISAPPQTLFVLIYGLWSPWWRTQTGRAIFTKSLALALLLNLSLVARAVGPYPGDEWVGVSVVALVGAGAWLQLIALLHEKARSTSTGNGFDTVSRSSSR